jgi:hypothetical protein
MRPCLDDQLGGALASTMSALPRGDHRQKGMQLRSNDYVPNGRKDAVSKGNSKHGYR